jgi:hypothetical protein
MKRLSTKTLGKFALPLVLLTSMLNGANAQNHSSIEPCATDIYHKQKLEADPGYAKSIELSELKVQKWISENRSHLKMSDDNKVVVPIVFHVVYNADSTETQMLPREKLLEQIETLNRDFNRDNNDKGRTRPVFDTIAESANIVFTLANKDPEGNDFDGITYTETDVVGFDLFPFLPGYVDLDSLKTTSGGGHDAWTDAYLNVWVARLTFFGSEGLYGIATFPQTMDSEEAGGTEPTPSELQGVSMMYNVVGNVLDANGDTLNAGRTLTHEIGHFFGLRHIWGDGQDGICGASDYVHDTPFAINNANFTCNFNLNECANEDAFWGTIDPPNNIENYMDYSGDLCYNMFSRGQTDRMNGFLYTERDALFSGEDNGGKSTSEFKTWVYTEPTSCPETCDGLATVNTLKASGSVKIFIDGNEITGNSVADLCTGIHDIIVIDNELDSIAYDFYVPAGLTVEAEYTEDVTDATCPTCADGGASISFDAIKMPYTIEWDVTPAVNGETLSNVLPGTYRFLITDGCGQEILDSVTISSAVGIDQLDFSDLKLAPNPTDGVINISLPKVENLSTAQVYDLGGRMLIEIKNIGKTNNLSVNAYGLEKGTYLLQLTDVNGHAITTRFLKH